MLLRCSAQLRVVGSSVIGLDLAAMLGIGEALGYDRAGLAELMPAGEAGMVMAVNERAGDTPVA